MTVLTQTSRLELSSNFPRPERHDQSAGTSAEPDHCKLDPGARVGLCLGGVVFLCLALKMAIDLMGALLRW